MGEGATAGPTLPHGFCVPSSLQLGVLAEERAALLELWELRRQQYEQCMDLQLFYRDTEQVDNWMSKQEVPRRLRPPRCLGGADLCPCCRCESGDEAVTKSAQRLCRPCSRWGWLTLGTGPRFGQESAAVELSFAEEDFFFFFFWVWDLALTLLVNLC